MTNKVYKIVLTGGPCSGKTTAMSTIKQYFSDDFVVYTLPEVATMTITSGVNIIPTNYTSYTHRVLTRSICQQQMDLEKYFEKIASIQNKDVIIVCDRGIMDNFAYCSEEVKKKILEETGWSLNYVCNQRYDQVIHLVTAAKGAEKFYQLENNEARYENLDQAKIIDGKTAQQWVTHHNVCMIDNSFDGFKEKMERVVNVISSLVKTPKPTFARKYLLKQDFDSSKVPDNTKVYRYVDYMTFLQCSRPDTKIWLTKRVFEEEPFPSYFITTRYFQGKYQDRQEKSRILTEKDYFDEMSHKDNNYSVLERKTQQFLYQQDNDYALCSIEQVLIDNKVFANIARIKRDSHNPKQVMIPKFIDIKEDITENQNFFSKNIALNK